MELKSLRKWGSGGFFALDLFYVFLLVLLLVSRQAHWLWVDRIEDPIGGIIPLGVPWFGALGAVTISIYGVVDHSEAWQTKWGLWHAIRPVVGAVLGTVAYLIFVGVIQATGTTPESIKTSSASNINTIVYLVIAFVVGFREQTFRTLITRVVDLLLSPGDSTQAPTVSISPSPVDFGTVAAGQHADVTVTLSNTGSGPLVVNDSSANPAGVVLAGDAAFGIIGGVIAGATVNPSASSSLVLRFSPQGASKVQGTLTINSNAGKFPIPLEGLGS